MRIQVTGCEKIFAEHIPDKELLSDIYNELLKLSNKKKSNLIKNGPRTIKGADHFQSLPLET